MYPLFCSILVTSDYFAAATGGLHLHCHPLPVLTPVSAVGLTAQLQRLALILIRELRWTALQTAPGTAVLQRVAAAVQTSVML